MTDPISTLRARVNESDTRNEELRTRLKEFETLLRDAVGDRYVSGSSKQCTFEVYGDNDYYYGYLTFNGALRVAYRNTEEDAIDLHEQSEPTYSLKDLDDCYPVWLRALAVPEIMNSLAGSLISTFEADIAATVEGVKTVEAVANLPFRELETGIAEVATKVGYVMVLEQWQKAQAALAFDPAEALTRASQLIETLCKHIIESNGQKVKPKADLKDLYKAAINCLSLSPDPKTSLILKSLNTGLVTVVQNVGALRNHASIAHGTSVSSHPLTLSQARVAVNSAGVLANFLMDAALANGLAGAANTTQP
jgi:hypothetical protein